MKKHITFIGSGAWASGLASVLSYNNHQVTLWGIDDKEVNDINHGINSKYFGDQKFNNPQNIRATKDLKQALEHFDFLVLAVPSNAIISVLKQIKDIIGNRKIKIINVAKGIDSKSKKFFSSVINDEFRENIEDYCTIIGPSFAVEVFANKLTMINIVGPNLDYLMDVTKIFNNDYFRLVLNPNETGSELYAALKNVLAIGIGMINYMMPFQNPQAALLSIGVKEIHKIYQKFMPHGSYKIGFELAGIGDIFLTCSSLKSRNFQFGYEVAKNGLKNVLANNQKTVEGYHNAKILEEILLTMKDIKTPFLWSIIDVLYHEKEPKKLLDFINTYI
ncbi:NAD(P)H-dependent glycerol-3-phosphate dehydrogenase [Mycoplasmopsis primatum]|uniref:NAD(P)H-dependent glycerol-3-phosphate dehydrogenase n=1 Tax=Mycoplasmopsis primatum TaxID=55604 RepID=UPI00049592B9|nr:NAD(P)H-dependent glycerol-3-phosphate dehydrogenase [Mycoplasmopsis primatum]